MSWLVGHLRAQAIADIWAAIHPDNRPSIALVRAVGLVAAPAPPARPLASYEPGDLVFVSHPAASRT